MARSLTELILALFCLVSIQMSANAFEEFRHNAEDRSKMFLKHKFDFQKTYGQQESLLKADQEHDVNRKVDSKIVFLSDDSDSNLRHYKPVPAPICNNQTFCEDASNYPNELIAAGLRRNKDLKWFSKTDFMPDVAHRTNVPYDDTSLCESYEKVIYPKAAKNMDEEWIFVVNQEKFVQGVRVEICRWENTNCSLIAGFANGYKTFCKQKYIYKQLAAVTPGGQIKPVTFRFPASCCCHVKFTGIPLFRIASDDVIRNKSLDLNV